MKQGKSKSSAFAICTESLKKKGKLTDEELDVLLNDIADVNEGTVEFKELMTYIECDALELWTAPSKRKDLSESRFFDPKNKKYIYKNVDGSINHGGVMAAWKMANGARSGEKADPGIISKIKPVRDNCLKQKKQSEVSHKFTFPISESILSDIELAANKPLEVQILKPGRFKHPWWGVLRFDDAFFRNIIKNFDTDIPQEKIAFDFSHRPELGAAAWVDKLFTKPEGLFSLVELTDEGKKAIKGGQFKYFSAEYADDFTVTEFEDEIDEEGHVREKEIKFNYGPTLIGGGLTNRPFLKGMKPVSLSEDGTAIEMEEISDDELFNQMSEEVKEKMKKTLDELKLEQGKLTKQLEELTATKKEDAETKTKIGGLEVQLEEIKVEMKKLSDTKTTGDADKAKKELADKEKALGEANQKLVERDAELKRLSEDIKSLTGSVKGLMDSNKELQEARFKALTEKRLQEFKMLGVFPSTLKIVEPILLSPEAKTFTVKLSEGEGEAKKETLKTLADVLFDVFTSIPADHRFSVEELSESVVGPSGGTKELSVEDVEKFAKDNTLSYDDALIELSRQGKIT